MHDDIAVSCIFGRAFLYFLLNGAEDLWGRGGKEKEGEERLS